MLATFFLLVFIFLVIEDYYGAVVPIQHFLHVVIIWYVVNRGRAQLFIFTLDFPFAAVWGVRFICVRRCICGKADESSCEQSN